MAIQESFSFPGDEADPFSIAKRALKTKRSGAFTDNMSLPVHRWFRYSAGFSGEWAARTISQHNLLENEYVFDPFTGSGTTLLAAQLSKVRAAGTEQHEFVFRVAQAKLSWVESERSLLEESLALLARAQEKLKPIPRSSSNLLRRCYSDDALCRLEALREAYLEGYPTRAPVGDLLWLAISAILRECSGVGTAQWQYVLPNKTKMRVLDPFAAFRSRIKMFCADMLYMKAQHASTDAELSFHDARDLATLSQLKNRVKLVLTSPPYPNNYDYADATRLEMTFWGEIGSWGDLQSVIRHRLIRSCSQHSAAEKLSLNALLETPVIRPIVGELTAACRELETIRETKGGKKTYHTMIAAYFIDLANTWTALKPLCTPNARACFVIGDSAPYGIYIPVERWLGELALAAGFRSYSFEKIRDRNIKWKNRKHRVPLKEGNLWVEA